MLEFPVMNAKEMLLIDKITERALKAFKTIGIERERMQVEMDIVFTYGLCCLRLKDLSEASRADFAHDILGIDKNLNRETGKMDNFFLPRFSR